MVLKLNNIRVIYLYYSIQVYLYMLVVEKKVNLTQQKDLEYLNHWFNKVNQELVLWLLG